MNIINAENLTKSYTERKLLDKASFYLQEGEKVGVIGINGTGKSTLLKIIAGLEEPDEGQVTCANHIVVRYLPQNPVFDPEMTVLDSVLTQCVLNFVGSGRTERTDADAHAQEQKWSLESDAKSMMTRLGITDFTQKTGELSGGQRKRLALVAALLVPCDVLILDEPTNHLDSAMADWLENYLKKWRGALVMITHDRYFLDSVCNRIVEVDKGAIYSYETNYSGYLERKAEREESAEASERKRQSVLRKELEWVRRGAKARTTKQKGRLQRYEELKNQKAPERDSQVEMSSVYSRMGKTTIELDHITKGYDGRTLLRDFSYIFLKGDRIGFIGANGSGKTTLMNMIYGIYYPDEGHIFVNGKEVTIRSPKDSYELGIGMVHQHFKLVDVLTAAENIVLGLPGKGKLDMKRITEDIQKLADKYGFELDLSQKIYEMSVSQKQTVEIIKMLYRGARILILDEPTAVLTPQESDRLFDILRNMRKDGCSIMIITHKLQEVLALSDRVAILRKGKYIDTVETAQANAQSLSEMMVGGRVDLNIDRPEPENVRKRLVVKGLNCKNKEEVKTLDDVDLTVNAGEILGIAGISGSGQKEFLEAIAGLQAIESGSITLLDDNGKGTELAGMDSISINKAGISLAFVPEDRIGMGLVGDMDMTDNMMLRSYRNGKSPFLDRKGPKALALKIKEQLEVMTPSISAPVRQMSGGNVQKVLVGREIAQNPKVLLVAFPTRGVDVNTSHVIYRLLNEQKKKGVAVVCVIEDLDVVLELCDRIAVFCGGKISGIEDGRTATKEGIGILMTKHEKGGTQA